MAGSSASPIRAVVELGGECGAAASQNFPRQGGVRRSPHVGVQLGAGMVEARDPAPDVSLGGRGTLGLDGEIADHVDAFAGRRMLEGDPCTSYGVNLADCGAVQFGHGAAGTS